MSALSAANRAGPGPTRTPGIDVGLLWHSMNSDNLGIGAMTLGHIALIEQVAAKLGLAPHFVVLGWRDPRPVYLERDALEVRAFVLRDFARVRSGFYSALGPCDVVLDIGAGDSFSDLYGVSRALKIMQAQIQVLMARKPLVLSPQTIGPFERRWVLGLARQVMNRAAAVASRDDLSADYANGLGLSSPVIRATDVSLRLPHDPVEPRRDGLLRIGINVSGLLLNGGYTRDNMFGLRVDYAELMKRIIRHFHRMAGIELHLIGHVQSSSQPLEDDQRAGASLAAAFDGTVVAPLFNDPFEAKSYIAGMDYFVGSRLHACIAAFAAGVPLLPLAYSRKFQGMFGSLGYHAHADCRKETAREILDKVEAGFEHRDRLRAELETARQRGMERLQAYERVLERLFLEVSERRRLA